MKKLCTYIMVLLLLIGIYGMRKRYKENRNSHIAPPYLDSPTAHYCEWHSDPLVETDLVEEIRLTACN